jgi:lysylphosphatidylglycerol synthetase-like protein (DUF2156 family)
MARSPKPPRTIKATLTRFIIASTIFVGLTLTCLLTADLDLRVIVGCFAFAAFLFALMYGINLGKAINREPMPTRRFRAVGAILVFPLAIFWVFVIGGGIAGVFVSTRKLSHSLMGALLDSVESSR